MYNQHPGCLTEGIRVLDNAAVTVAAYVWLWNSQPFIKTIPAGNILLCAVILFSMSKLSLLKLPTCSMHYTDRTVNLYLHQTFELCTL